MADDTTKTVAEEAAKVVSEEAAKVEGAAKNILGNLSVESRKFCTSSSALSR